MTEMDSHVRIVGECLADERPVDEQACASVAVLAERLERLKQSSSVFAGIGFSPHVKKLKRQVEALVVS
jgi:hypothetical protein